MTGQGEIDPFQHFQLRRLRPDERQRQIRELAVNLRALEFPVIVAKRDERDRLVADLDGPACLSAQAMLLPPDKDICAGYPPEPLQDFILDKHRRIVDFQAFQIAGETFRVRLPAEFLQDIEKTVPRYGLRLFRRGGRRRHFRAIAHHYIFIAELDGATCIAVQPNAQACKLKLRRGNPPPQEGLPAEHHRDIRDRGNPPVLLRYLQIVHRHHQVLVAPVPFQADIAESQFIVGILRRQHLLDIGREEGERDRTTGQRRRQRQRGKKDQYDNPHQGPVQ